MFDNDGKLHFEFKGKDSVDVYFNNIAYKLKEIYIGKRRHVSYPEDPTIVGECTLFHTGNNDNLVISIFLRSTRGFSDSQDFFSQFLSKKVGTQNYDKTIDITTSCPDAQSMTVISVAVTSNAEAGQFITNEFRWTDGNFFSPTKTYANTAFSSSTNNPIVSLYEQEAGFQGGGFIDC